MYDAKYFTIILFFIVIKWCQNVYHFDTLAIYYALNSYFFNYILVKLTLSYFLSYFINYYAIFINSSLSLINETWFCF